MSGPYLVLANSRKLGGHCVAVADRSGAWIRPVSDQDHGELSRSMCELEGESRMLRLLDVVEASFGRSVATPHQPEDFEVPAVWRQIRPGPTKGEIQRWLASLVDHGADFLARGTQDRISASDVAVSPLQSSLTLVEPRDPVWVLQWGASGKLQVRAEFKLDGLVDASGRVLEFDLGVTDPDWVRRVKLATGGDPGEVDGVDLGVGGTTPVYMTISLGESYRGSHFKLVAGVIAANDEA